MIATAHLDSKTSNDVIQPRWPYQEHLRFFSYRLDLAEHRWAVFPRFGCKAPQPN